MTIDTQSDPESQTVPSTEKQKDLSRLLAAELSDLGLVDAAMDDNGYVLATLPSSRDAESAPTVALIAHVDTSPDESGSQVKPIIHERYDGRPIHLPGDPNVVLDPSDDDKLHLHVGQDLITSDGTTLLGSDDKAGVAVIMQYVEDALVNNTLRPRTRICFTIDEEIGRGVDHLSLENLDADIAYTLDGSGVDNISVETFNAAEAVFTVTGVMVHPGYAQGIMVNAVRIASAFVDLLPDDEAPETTSGAEGYYHPHVLMGDSVQEVSVRTLLRDFSWEGLERRKAFVQQATWTIQNRFPNAEIELSITDTYRNMRSYIEEADPRAIEVAETAARNLGIHLESEPIRGGTDGARLSERGLPTPNLFTGGYRFHSTKEWNTVQNLERSLAYLTELMTCWSRADPARTKPPQQSST